MEPRLSGKIALVTGSNRGIGQGVALRLAQEGADVIVNYHSHEDEAHRTVDQIIRLGRKSAAIQADLSRVEEIGHMMEQAFSRFGRIDVLVNNAAMEKASNFWEVTESDYDAMLDVDLKGAFFASQAFIRPLIETGRGGKIINMSSVHEELPFPHFTPYCMSKGGLKMMTRSLAIELALYGITVNAIAPGAIQTPINTALLHDQAKLERLLENIPLGRMGTPADVAGVAAFLASSDADYITGTTVFVDGGLLWNYEEQ